MKLSVVLLAFIAVHVRATVLTRGNIEPLSVEHVEFINQLNTTWKAAQNFKGYKIDELRGLCGTLLNGNNKNVPILPDINVDSQKLPNEFDSRKHWPECTNVISHIRDQGSCGSCWAVASASAITGRVCIASKGKKTAQLSAQELTSCCGECAPTEGCQGGFPIEAWTYWSTDGLVTGADYGDKKTCAPYLLAPCEHHVEGSRPKCDKILPTPKCSLKCTNQQIDFKNDKNYGLSSFETHRSVRAIKTELLNRGPLTAAFTVYDDFLLYKEGVYQVTPGAKPVGGHAVELIGWGLIDDGTEYWLIKNNWNTDWGDNGLFKIKIGEAGINDAIVGGLARENN